jgi:hypothetical protein
LRGWCLMARKHRPFPRWGRCKLMRESWETWYGGLCPACRDFYAKKRQRKVGARLSARNIPQESQALQKIFGTRDLLQANPGRPERSACGRAAAGGQRRPEPAH